MTETNETDPRDRKQFVFRATTLRHLLIFVLRPLFSLFMKLETHGIENLPSNGPAVVAANHVTNFDVFPMQFALPRPIFFMAKSELFKFPLMDVALRNLGAFPVYRGEKDQWALRHALKVLTHGQILGMFPEGTRSKGRGLTVAKTGSARLALEANCPIVPMIVIGSDHFFRHFPRRARVTIQLLPPIHPKPGDTPLSLTDRLMFTLAASLPPDMRGVYKDAPGGFEEGREAG